MKSKRLKAIVSFLDSKDSFIDIGCDHGYVSIHMAYLGAKNILATDIHEEALNRARENIFKEHLDDVIQLQVADGLEGILVSSYDTLVISGMGTSTIQHILRDKNKLQTIQKMILQSNNDLYELRLFMMNLGYFLSEEEVLFEQNHYYTVLKYVKGMQKLREEELEFGLYQKKNASYYEFLNQKYLKLLGKIPKEKKEYKIYQRKLNLLQNYL